jgi:uncharacterized membrane protein YhiD involved in acid resistance
MKIFKLAILSISILTAIQSSEWTLHSYIDDDTSQNKECEYKDSNSQIKEDSYQANKRDVAYKSYQARESKQNSKSNLEKTADKLNEANRIVNLAKSFANTIHSFKNMDW